jgi:excisionase family DNA binding protein
MKTRTLFSPLDRRKSVTLGDISEASGIPLQTLRDQIARGEIPGVFRSGPGKGRKWRISRADAETWWQQMQSPKALIL